MGKEAYIDSAFGFNIQGTTPDVKRQQINSLGELPERDNEPDGYIVFCLSNGKRYEYRQKNVWLASTGRWREYTASVDLHDYATKAYVDDKLKKREVKPATAAYIANPPHEQDMDILYVVPVEGEDYFNEYIATRERKPQTVPIIDGEPTPIDSNKIYVASEFQDPELIVALGQEAIILDVKDGVCGFYHNGSESDDAEYPRDYDWVPCNVGDRFWVNDGESWVAGSESEWYCDGDAFIYSWLSLGTTEYNVSGKQDALTADGNVLTANVGGVNYAITAEQIAAPSVPVISPNGGDHDKKLEITLRCATAGAQIRYTLTTNGNEPATPTVESTLYNGNSIKINADNTHEYITVKIKAISVKYGQVSASIASETFKLYRICDAPSISDASGTEFDNTRTVTLSMSGKQPNDASLLYNLGTSGAAWQNYDANTGIVLQSSETAYTVRAQSYKQVTGEVWKPSTMVSKGGIIVGQLKMYYGSERRAPGDIAEYTDEDVENLTADASRYTPDASNNNLAFVRSFSRSQAGAPIEGENENLYYAIVAYPKKTITANGVVNNAKLSAVFQGVTAAGFDMISAWSYVETDSYHVYYAPVQMTSVSFAFVG